MNSKEIVFHMPREVDQHVASKLAEEIDRQILLTSARQVVFDFAKTEFMDSAGVGLMIGRYRKLYCMGGKIIALNISDRFKRIFVASGLHRIIEINYENKEEKNE